MHAHPPESPAAREDRDSPHRALLRAVLDIAVRDLRSYGRIRDMALVWFEDDDDGAFSFRWICDVLGMDVDWLRQRLRSLSAETQTAIRDVVRPLMPGWLSIAALRGVELRIDLPATMPLAADERAVVGGLLDRLVPEAIQASPPCAGASVAVVVAAPSKRILRLSVRQVAREASGLATGAPAETDDTMTMLRAIAKAHAARWRRRCEGHRMLVQVELPRLMTSPSNGKWTVPVPGRRNQGGIHHAAAEASRRSRHAPRGGIGADRRRTRVDTDDR